MAGRAELAPEEMHRQYWSVLPRDDVFAVLELIEFESQIPSGLLRPADVLRDVFAPPSTRNPFRWMEFQTRSGDGFLESNSRLNRRLKDLGRLDEWGNKVYTLGDLVHAWCGADRTEVLAREAGTHRGEGPRFDMLAGQPLTPAEGWKSRVVQICCDAAAGAMTLKRFHDTWPHGVGESVLAHAIFDDLEDGVEHFPGTFWSGRPDFDSWYASDMYRLIMIDLAILGVEADEARLLQLRGALIDEPDLPIDHFVSRLSELMGRTEKGW